MSVPRHDRARVPRRLSELDSVVAQAIENTRPPRTVRSVLAKIEEQALKAIEADLNRPTFDPIGREFR